MTPTSAGNLSAYELGARRILQAVFFVVGLKAIYQGAFIGQDFGFHYECVQSVLSAPHQWFHMDVTSRPLIYWLAAACHTFTHGNYGIPLTSLLFLTFTTISFAWLHRTLACCIKSPVLRLGAITVVAALPVVLVSTVVFAADAPTLPFALLVIYLLVRGLDVSPATNSARWITTAGLCLGAAQFAKFTFILFPIGILLALAILRWCRRPLPIRLELFTVLCVGIFPLLIGGYLHQRAAGEMKDQPSRHSYDFSRWYGTGELTWRSLVLPRLTDLKLLAAPTYWQPSDRPDDATLRLLQSNRYSYPGLLHLGLHTDVLNYAAGSRHTEPRDPAQAFAARFAATSGLAFSALGLGGLLGFLFCLASAILRRQSPPSLPLLFFGILGFAWFGPVFFQLPYIHHAYEWGYWLPRLILPFIVGSVVLGVHLLDRLSSHRRWLSPSFALLVAVYAFFAIRSLWG